MKFGVIPAYQVAPVETAAYARGFGRLVESLGFESVWPVEHVVMPADYTSRYPYDPSGRMPIPEAAIPDPVVWNTFVAAGTEHLLLGSSVVILPQHNPVVFAKSLASLDVLSGGRVLLGAGIGWLREEAEAVGTSFGNRGRRTDEAIGAMRALWTDEVASFKGEFVHFEKVCCRPQPARPIPILVGGHSDAAARRAGRLGDGFLPLGVAADELARLRRVMAEAAEEAGRDPADIEITCIGAADLETAERYREVGVHRLIVASHEPDLAAAERALAPFASQVVAHFG